VGKFKAFLNEYPAVKIFGPIGIIVVVALIALSAIFQSEIVRVWDAIFHREQSAALVV